MTDQTLKSQEKEVVDYEEGERTRDRRLFVPRSDIYETDDHIVILVDLPGVDEKSVDITLEKDVLTIKGFPGDQRPEGYDIAYSEYGIGDFQRSFVLSVHVDRDNIQANVKNGVLTLQLPKAGPDKTRKIQVKGG